MSKYLIRVEKGPDFHPEFDNITEEMKKGIQADGFVVMAHGAGYTGKMIVHGISIVEIAELLAGDEAAPIILRQARAIADGMEKAKIIARESKRQQTARELVDMLRADRED